MICSARRTMRHVVRQPTYTSHVIHIFVLFLQYRSCWRLTQDQIFCTWKRSRDAQVQGSRYYCGCHMSFVRYRTGKESPDNVVWGCGLRWPLYNPNLVIADRQWTHSDVFLPHLPWPINLTFYTVEHLTFFIDTRQNFVCAILILYHVFTF